MEDIAFKLGLSASEVRYKNLYRDGDTSHINAILSECHLTKARQSQFFIMTNQPDTSFRPSVVAAQAKVVADLPRLGITGSGGLWKGTLGDATPTKKAC